jgi:hypothetical protein
MKVLLMPVLMLSAAVSAPYIQASITEAMPQRQRDEGLWCGTGVDPAVLAALDRNRRLQEEARKRVALERLWGDLGRVIWNVVNALHEDG